MSLSQDLPESGNRLTVGKIVPRTDTEMKKIVLFIFAALVVMTFLSKLPSAQAGRTIIVPTPTAAPVVSSR